jgi:import receptor subunit TOM20
VCYISGIVLLSISTYCISKQLPDLKDAEAVQKFFLEEIQLGEELLAQGNGHYKTKKLNRMTGSMGQVVERA